MLHSVDWQFVTDVSCEPVVPTFRGKAAQEDCLTVGDGIVRLSRNVGNRTANLWTAWSLKMGPINSEMLVTNNRCTLRNIPEERRPLFTPQRNPEIKQKWKECIRPYVGKLLPVVAAQKSVFFFFLGTLINAIQVRVFSFLWAVY